MSLYIRGVDWAIGGGIHGSPAKPSKAEQRPGSRKTEVAGTCHYIEVACFYSLGLSHSYLLPLLHILPPLHFFVLQRACFRHLDVRLVFPLTMRFTPEVALGLLASTVLVQAQTYTDCNPTKKCE